MARIRSIKPEFFTSRSNARLPVTARLTFIGLWTHVDDEGRAPDEPRLIKAALWPLDDKHTAAKVDADLAALDRAGKIRRYVVDGDPYLAVVEWHHQKIDRRKDSEYPPPPEAKERRVIDDGSTNDQRGDDEGSSPDLDLGSGSDRIGSEAVAKATPKRATAAPSAFLLDDDLRRWATENAPSVDLDRETARWLDHHRAKGSTFKDWRAAWRTWMSRAVDYAPRALPAVPHGAPRSTPGQQAIDRVFSQLPRGAA